MKKLFEKVGDIGILPIFFNEVRYLPDKKIHSYTYDELIESFTISGTKIRDLLINGKVPPKWLMRDKVANVIIESIKSGEQVFSD